MLQKAMHVSPLLTLETCTLEVLVFFPVKKTTLTSGKPLSEMYLVLEA